MSYSDPYDSAFLDRLVPGHAQERRENAASDATLAWMDQHDHRAALSEINDLSAPYQRFDGSMPDGFELLRDRNGKVVMSDEAFDEMLESRRRIELAAASPEQLRALTGETVTR